MLVLSRKAGQKIHIGDEIVVEIRRIAGNRVTIALEAPRDMRILRGELHDAANEFSFELDDELVERAPVEHSFRTGEIEFDLAGIGSGGRVEVA